MDWEIKHRRLAQGVYEIIDTGWTRRFLEKLERRVPHSDQIPSGIFHKLPAPSLSFDVTFSTLNYEDLRLKLHKILKRLRVSSPRIIKYTFSSSLYLLVPGEWDEKSTESLQARILPQATDFENYYFLSEDLSFGLIGAVNGMKFHAFGKPVLDLINTNRALWPEFWKSR